MTKKLFYLLLLTTACVALLAISVSARAVFDQASGDRVLDKRTNNITQYGFPRIDREPVRAVGLKDYDPLATARNWMSTRSSLGTAGLAETDPSPGLTIKQTWDDWQWSYNGGRVEFTSDVPSI
ncbi:MAG TPA: hypothetical protein VMY05_00715, partial [Acidobacteriota bacterium]|nr:hypothetical protein [Acidobacteriota bacterium]